MESSSSEMGGGILFVGFMLVCGLIALEAMVFWCWMLIHSLINSGLTGSEKLARTPVILFGNLSGTIIHLFVGCPKARLAPVMAFPGARLRPGQS